MNNISKTLQESLQLTGAHVMLRCFQVDKRERLQCAQVNSPEILRCVQVVVAAAVKNKSLVRGSTAQQILLALQHQCI